MREDACSRVNEPSPPAPRCVPLRRAHTPTRAHGSQLCSVPALFQALLWRPGPHGFLPAHPAPGWPDTEPPAERDGFGTQWLIPSSF